MKLYTVDTDILDIYFAEFRNMCKKKENSSNKK